MIDQAQERRDLSTSPSAREEPATRDEDCPEIPAAPDSYRPLSIVFRVSSGIGLALIVIGSALSLIRESRLPTETPPLTALWDGLMRLESSTLVSLGILTFLVTPAAGLAILLISFLRHAQRLYALVAATVLTILLVSVIIAQATS